MSSSQSVLAPVASSHPAIVHSSIVSAGSATEQELSGWETVYSQEAWKRIRAEGIYLASVLLFGVVVCVILLIVPFSDHEGLRQLMYCALGGITGSWIYSMKLYVRVVTKGIWRHDLIAWRLATPFMGIFTAISTYAMLQTGLLGVTFVAPNGPNTTNDPKLFAYAVGFMVGLFSDVVMGKLTEVAETLFGRTAHAKKD